MDTILTVARERAADLIVMTTAGRHGFLDALRGSTTERVLRGGAIPLLAIPAAIGCDSIGVRRQAEKAVTMAPTAADAYSGPYLGHQLARIYLLVGETEKALNQLRLDPEFDPLRKHRRFERWWTARRSGGGSRSGATNGRSPVGGL